MRILIVEDEVKLANAIKRALQLKKYTVDVANDGETGFDLASGESYDLILLDLMLPKMDGLQVCSKLRQEGTTTPVLMLTAKGQVTDKITGLDIGADDYMVKPFSFEELFARIRALSRRSQPTDNQNLVVGDLELDPVAYKVKRAGQNVELSAKEFSILDYLLRHKNTVITRQQLLDHVWNYDTDVLPTTVEVHIKHLRDKVNIPNKPDIIKTIRGFGYEITDTN